MSSDIDYSHISAMLERSLALRQAAIAICFSDDIPVDLQPYSSRVPAGCRFWQDASETSFFTVASDHAVCAIGVYTHNLVTSEAQQIDLHAAIHIEKVTV